jgi:hypothetical protein
MASTFSTSLKLELIGNGDQSGTWGTTTNTNLGTLLEQAITGVQNITMANANITLTSTNGTSDQARNAVLVVGGTNSAIRNIVAPSVNKTYIIANNTVGGFAILIKTSSSTGLSIPNGATQLVYCDGSEFYLSGQNITTATASTPNTVVLRDGSGNFAANIITSSLAGVNVSSSGTLAVTGGLTLDGAAGTSGQVMVSAGASNTPTWGNAFASGMIMLWSGSIATIPSGWLLCDGTSGTPNLRDRFIVGAGSTYAVGATGGSADAVVVSHSHSITDPGHNHTIWGPIAGNLYGQDVTYTHSFTLKSSTNVTGVTINTAGVSGTNANLPPYYALAYIMKS